MIIPVTPEQARRLLSVKNWPPQLEHWPPRDKSAWRPGMLLQGLIEAVMTLPRPDGSPRRGEPYLAMYIRRLSDRRLVMWHGYRTADQDVASMHPAPGLLFTAFYRGERDNGFEDFKFLVTPYDPPAQQQARADTGEAPSAPPARAPEEGATSPAPSSGSTQPTDAPPGPDRVTSPALARAYIRGQSEQFQTTFRRLSQEARDSGELAGWSELEGYQVLITRTHKHVTREQMSGGAAA
jgi:hypothetical protein